MNTNAWFICRTTDSLRAPDKVCKGCKNKFIFIKKEF